MKTFTGQRSMKNKAFRIFCFVLFFFIYLYLMPGCKKSGTAGDHGNGNASDPPPVTGTNCTAAKADAENLQLFPADNAWNLDISSAQVDPYNSQIIAGFASNVIKADFGSGLWEGAPIGIPYVVVCGNQTKYTVVFRSNSYDGNYGDESDAGPYPVPLTAPVEGNGQGDSHVIAVDEENKILYELYNASVNNGHWEASSGAIFDLKTNTLRPDGWTSADAAGLPIFAGLVRYEEILKGVIDHPIRFTLPSAKVKPAYIHPARHKVNSTGGQFSSLPFGTRIRLKAGFDLSSFSATNKIILTAMKKYGLILADIGSNLYITGSPDERWNNDDLRLLGQVHGSDFEVVKFNN
ncbi:MAG: hypothetical protein JNK14_15665 [Chitinophagaceae bacterium]|nr:hypothetical protein [Chitinophagaceae bacterium]